MTTTPITFRDMKPKDNPYNPDEVMNSIKRLEEQRPDIAQIMQAMDGAFITGYNHAIDDALSVLEKHKKIYEGVEDLIAQLKDLKK